MRGEVARARRIGVTISAMLAVLTAPSSVAAQEWRSLESSRQLRGDGPMSVRVEYAAGTVDLVPTDDRVLYRMRLRYDAERSAPLSVFDEAARTLTIGTRSAGTTAWRSSPREGNTLHAELARGVPMRLTLELGATRGDIELGGLRLTELMMRAGASETRIDFSAPNPESLALLDLDVGAASVSVRRGGNARAQRVHVNVGAGSLDYDLSGSWDGEVDLSANVAVGSMVLRVPVDVGVRVTAKTFLADFSRSGLEKRGEAWVTPGYDSAKRRVRGHVTAVLGGFEIIRR
jgi:hypothetical protein